MRLIFSLASLACLISLPAFADGSPELSGSPAQNLTTAALPTVPPPMTAVALVSFETLTGGSGRVVVNVSQLSKMSGIGDGVRGLSSVDINSRVTSTGIKSIVPGLTFSEQGAGSGNAIVVESAAQAQQIMGTARVLLPKLETMIFAAAAGGQARNDEEFAIQLAQEEMSFHDLGTLVASSAESMLPSNLSNRSGKFVSMETDRRASEYALSLWLVCYGLMHRDGKVLLTWGVSRAIRKANAFYNAMFNEMASLAEDPNNRKNQMRLKMMRKAVDNSDLRLVREWLVTLSKSVVIEQEIKQPSSIPKAKRTPAANQG